MSKPGRNDPCPCGSGKKYKQCCQPRQELPAEQKRALLAQVPAAIRTALAQQRAGRLAQAAGIYRQILAIAPDHPDALHLLGAIQLQESRIDMAIETIQRAIRANPSNFESHNNLGFALHERGRLEPAIAHYRKALALKPDYAGALFNLHALLLDAADRQPAMDCLEQVLALQPQDTEARCMLGVLLDHDGRAAEAERHFALLEHGAELARARLDAWRYLKAAGGCSIPITGSMLQTFKTGLAAAPHDGLVLEFGVRFGNSIRQIAELVGPRQAVHGFDSFEGLPEAWHEEGKGSYSTRGEIPEVPRHVHLHVGWFENTLPDFLERHPGQVRFVNIDCDIYSSTQTILDLLAPRMVAGSVLVFDEYIGNARWREDEFKAFQEAVARYGWNYEYLCFSPFTKQVAVRITTV